MKVEENFGVVTLQLYLFITLVVKMKLCKMVVAVGFNTNFLLVLYDTMLFGLFSQLYFFITLVVKMKLGKVVIAVGCNTDFLPVFPAPP